MVLGFDAIPAADATFRAGAGFANRRIIARFHRFGHGVDRDSDRGQTEAAFRSPSVVRTDG